MNLEQIQEMWERDSKIDPDNLHDESLKIPQLHSKYYTLYNTITLLREKAREQENVKCKTNKPEENRETLLLFSCAAVLFLKIAFLHFVYLIRLIHLLILY